jgi:hypothetical protein
MVLFLLGKKLFAILSVNCRRKSNNNGDIQRKHLTETIINVPDENVMQQANKILTPYIE